MKKTRLITNEYCNTDYGDCPYLYFLPDARYMECKMVDEILNRDYKKYYDRPKRLKGCIKTKFNAWVEMEKK